MRDFINAWRIKRLTIKLLLGMIEARKVNVGDTRYALHVCRKMATDIITGVKYEQS